MRERSLGNVAMLATVIMALAVPVMAGHGQAMDKVGGLQTISSEAMQFTVAYPDSWHAAIAFSNVGKPEYVVEEHSRFSSPAGAEISISVWDRAGVESIDAWLEMHHELLSLENRQATARKVTKAGLQARVYVFDSSGGHAANQTKTYFIMGEKIFEISYYMADEGAASDHYWALIDSMSLGATGDDLLLPAQLMPEQPQTSKVYSCGGYSDTCYCAAWNPFPCCSNGGNCTWWGWHMACCNWGIDIPPRGNANTWDNTFHAYGYQYRNCNYPAIGWIAVRNSGTYGHVAWVTAISGDSVQVSEQNCWGGYGVSYTWYHKCWFDAGYFHN